MPKPPIGVFSADVFAVMNENQDLLQEHRSTVGSVPQTLPELIDKARDLAVDLIVFRSLDEARAHFEKDCSGLHAADTLMNKLVSEENVLATIKRAHATLKESVIMEPCHAFAAFLIELCGRLRVVTEGGRLSYPDE